MENILIYLMPLSYVGFIKQQQIVSFSHFNEKKKKLKHYIYVYTDWEITQKRTNIKNIKKYTVFE